MSTLEPRGQALTKIIIADSAERLPPTQKFMCLFRPEVIGIINRSPIHGIVSGSINVAGVTTINNVDGVGVSVEDVGATVTFNELNIDTTGQDGIISGVAFDNPGIVNVNGGLFNNIGQDGFRIGSGNFGSGVLGGFNLNNTTFTNVGADTGNVSNSLLSGSGNTASPFSCTDLGNNTGKIFFNGGADSCPN